MAYALFLAACKQASGILLLYSGQPGAVGLFWALPLLPSFFWFIIRS
ncbi:hypothetical protein MUN84_02560 [Hymenobacter sp. 5516J-16]|nr:hypothetical protein [Hymenobacter sp. 5516J-16]UOQ77592.1 hypothetical protein MUN84_02560 [Hymenobacter sp. 5516J-16]